MCTCEGERGGRSARPEALRNAHINAVGLWRGNKSTFSLEASPLSVSKLAFN